MCSLQLYSFGDGAGKGSRVQQRLGFFLLTVVLHRCPCVPRFRNKMDRFNEFMAKNHTPMDIRRRLRAYVIYSRWVAAVVPLCALLSVPA